MLSRVLLPSPSDLLGFVHRVVEAAVGWLLPHHPPGIMLQARLTVTTALELLALPCWPLEDASVVVSRVLDLLCQAARSLLQMDAEITPAALGVLTVLHQGLAKVVQPRPGVVLTAVATVDTLQLLVFHEVSEGTIVANGLGLTVILARTAVAPCLSRPASGLRGRFAPEQAQRQLASPAARPAGLRQPDLAALPLFHALDASGYARVHASMLRHARPR